MMLDYILNLDKQLFELINSHWTAGWANTFFPMVTDLHKSVYFKWLFVPLVFVLFSLNKGIKRGSIVFLFAILSVLLSDGIGNHAFKKTVQRPRPAHTENLHVEVRAPFGGYSFVSNHSTNMYSFATFTSVVFPPMTIPMFTLATVIGYSRIYNGVHFPADVIVGGLLGALIGFLFAKLYQKLEPRLPAKRKKS